MFRMKISVPLTAVIMFMFSLFSPCPAQSDLDRQIIVDMTNIGSGELSPRCGNIYMAKDSYFKLEIERIAERIAKNPEKYYLAMTRQILVWEEYFQYRHIEYYLTFIDDCNNSAAYDFVFDLLKRAYQIYINREEFIRKTRFKKSLTQEDYEEFLQAGMAGCFRNTEETMGMAAEYNGSLLASGKTIRELVLEGVNRELEDPEKSIEYIQFNISSICRFFKYYFHEDLVKFILNEALSPKWGKLDREIQVGFTYYLRKAFLWNRPRQLELKKAYEDNKSRFYRNQFVKKLLNDINHDEKMNCKFHEIPEYGVGGFYRHVPEGKKALQGVTVE